MCSSISRWKSIPSVTRNAECVETCPIFQSNVYIILVSSSYPDTPNLISDSSTSGSRHDQRTNSNSSISPLPLITRSLTSVLYASVATIRMKLKAEFTEGSGFPTPQRPLPFGISGDPYAEAFARHIGCRYGRRARYPLTYSRDFSPTPIAS